MGLMNITALVWLQTAHWYLMQMKDCKSEEESEIIKKVEGRKANTHQQSINMQFRLRAPKAILKGLHTLYECRIHDELLCYV
jgi:hypothetical protein